MTGGGAFIFCQFLLHAVKQLLGDDCGYSSRSYNFPVTVFANIFPVVQNCRYKIQVYFLSPYSSHPGFIEIVAYLLHGFAAVILRKNILHNRGQLRGDLIAHILAYVITECRSSPVIFAF